jgi:adenylate kinase family enzyme
VRKVVIFGNSGSGKSTLAKQISSSESLPHLDLDTLAWQASAPPKRRPLNESMSEISYFVAQNKCWVIEGCYSDLLEAALRYSNELIFMNLPVEMCIENARKRPWESHKYKSKAAQDSNLDMLIGWISEYTKRVDTFSQAAHSSLYEQYAGNKRMVTSNENAN